jgi:hypothetical protein
LFYRTIDGASVAVFLGSGDGSFAYDIMAGARLDPADAAAMLTADWNEDGKPDLAVLEASTANGLAILIGNGDGTFQPPVFYDAGYYPTALATGDLRQSGHLDLLAPAHSGTLRTCPAPETEPSERRQFSESGSTYSVAVATLTSGLAASHRISGVRAPSGRGRRWSRSSTPWGRSRRS